MDPHMLPPFNDGRFDSRTSTYRTKPIVVNGQKFEHASSFTPPSEMELSEMMQTRKSNDDDDEPSQVHDVARATMNEAHEEKSREAKDHAKQAEVWKGKVANRNELMDASNG